MIIYNRKIRESDLKKSKEIIYFYDNNICYLITDMDTHFIVKRKKIYTDFQFWVKKIKTSKQVLKAIA